MLQISGYFPVCSLRHQLLLSIFPSQNGLEQRWFLKRRVEELLAQKGFCWPSTGWPEHALQRRVSFAMAKGTASPMYSSLESKQRGFCRPRQLLLVWRHLVLLLLPSLASPQTAEGRAEACGVSQQVGDFTLWKTRKYFLSDSVEDGSWTNTSKT